MLICGKFCTPVLHATLGYSLRTAMCSNHPISLHPYTRIDLADFIMLSNDFNAFKIILHYLWHSPLIFCLCEVVVFTSEQKFYMQYNACQFVRTETPTGLVASAPPEYGWFTCGFLDFFWDSVRKPADNNLVGTLLYLYPINVDQLLENVCYFLHEDVPLILVSYLLTRMLTCRIFYFILYLYVTYATQAQKTLKDVQLMSLLLQLTTVSK